MAFNPRPLCLLRWHSSPGAPEGCVRYTHREAWPGRHQSQRQELEEVAGAAPLPACPQLSGISYVMAARAWKPGRRAGVWVTYKQKIQAGTELWALPRPEAAPGKCTAAGGPGLPCFPGCVPTRHRALRRASRVLWGTQEKRERADHPYSPGGGKIMVPDGHLSCTTVHVPALSPPDR